jgi:hypothetical protein
MWHTSCSRSDFRSLGDFASLHPAGALPVQTSEIFDQGTWLCFYRRRQFPASDFASPQDICHHVLHMVRRLALA